MRGAKNGTQRVSSDRRFTSFIPRIALAATILIGFGPTVTASAYVTSASRLAGSVVFITTFGMETVDGDAASTDPNESNTSAADDRTIGGIVAQNRPPGVTTYQETSTSVAYSGSWSGAGHPGYLGGRALSSNHRGALASLRFTGIGISWIGPTGPTRGKAKVFVDGRYVKTVDTYSPRFDPSRVLYSATYPTERERTFAIEVLGTEGHPTIALDALLVRSDGSLVAPSPPRARSEPATTPAPMPTSTPTSTPMATPVPTPTPTPMATPVPTPTPSVTPTSIGTSAFGSPSSSGPVRLSNCSNVVIDNKTFKDLGAGVIAIRIENCTNVTISSVDFSNVAEGVYALNSSNIKIIDSRYSNITGPAQRRTGANVANFVQFNNVAGGLIARNKGKGGDTEDVVSVYQSDHVTVEDNHFEGTNWTSRSGSGIALSDGGGSYNVAQRNILVNPGQVGIFIAGGMNNKILDNIIIGQQRSSSNVGVYVWDQSSSPCAAQEVSRNRVFWQRADGIQNPYWNAGNCGSVAGSGNVWNDTSLNIETYRAVL